ncbi:MAG: ABC transporter permease subunit [Balneolales bacterium]|nr:ABC transporter permease subunit [Balneolales bacterium]
MLKILKYSFYDLMRSRWSYFYFLFFLAIGFILLFLNSDLSKAIITLMNIIIVLTPLIGIVFGVMYFYSAREFRELLLAQPIKRGAIFIGQYLGLAISLSLSLLLGLGIPFLFYGLFQSAEIINFLVLIVVGIFLTFIFVGIAFTISLRHNNKIKGFGYAILSWLFLAVIYDGLFLISLILLHEYPLDKFTLFITMLNPIDLSRILIILKLDISALMGFTGALFQKYFGTGFGFLITTFALLIWSLTPVYLISRIASKKDF